jgi:hypothetical protein
MNVSHNPVVVGIWRNFATDGREGKRTSGNLLRPLEVKACRATRIGSKSMGNHHCCFCKYLAVMVYEVHKEDNWQCGTLATITT